MAPEADEPVVVDAWTRAIAGQYGLADILDVFSGGVRYRVFLLQNSLQIDVSFWPQDDFRATEPGFTLLFGTANVPTQPAPPNTDNLIGMGWLYALHARSATARGKLWQAAIMIDDLRNQVIALKCARRGLEAWHGRQVDALPAAELQNLEKTRVARLAVDELEASRIRLTDHLLEEIARIDPQRATRLGPAFAVLRQPG
ncbi:nucleotidyltransferase domain-containing protein [Microbacterium sp. NPDC056044]|uniref:nucleotidyltransferase domain-containing protein n=1 Tax=Microbacterium sp. NPDC056044 TaxID=3345690 RepID=UPI0035DB444C